MKLKVLAIASTALLATLGAQAAVTGSLGGGGGTFLTLSGAGLDGGSVATLTGGSVYAASDPFAAMPVGTVGDFLAAGTNAGPSATLTFLGGVSYVSFLWGSPDGYNLLTVNDSTGGSQVFSASGLGFGSVDGNQAIAQQVQFFGLDDAKITSLTFTNMPQTNAFETANFTVTPVPEPGTYALLMAGLGIMGFVARRREERA